MKSRKGRHQWGKSLKGDMRELTGPKRTDKQRGAESKKSKGDRP